MHGAPAQKTTTSLGPELVVVVTELVTELDEVEAPPSPVELVVMPLEVPVSAVDALLEALAVVADPPSPPVFPGFPKSSSALLVLPQAAPSAAREPAAHSESMMDRADIAIPPGRLSQAEEQSHARRTLTGAARSSTG
jgi:hypothetical protein